jgi:putative oxidoreductase
LARRGNRGVSRAIGIMDRSFLLFVVRACLSAVYLYSGFDKLLNWQNGLAFVNRFSLPYPRVVLTGTIIVQLVGGFALLTGFHAREGAILLALFTVAATLACHYPIGLRGSDLRRELTLSLEHLAIVGGLLAVAIVV